MVTLTNLKHLKRNEKIKILKILRALNYIYSLRYLESLIDISYQNLWKYVNMLAIPSDEVAIDILNKLNNLKIVDKAITDIINNNRNNIYKIASDIGFLSLYVLKIEDSLKEYDIGIAIPLSEYSVPFSTILSWELGLRLCTPIFSRKVREPKIKIMWYYSQQENELELFLLPKTCIDEESEALLVDISLNDIEKLKAVLQLLKSSEISVKAIVTIYIGKECLEFLDKTNVNIIYISVI